ncbi:uncharacterized protein N7511_007639 [Penicillium nucicola]|uniref:uncharacterized protein n=1 Tax=Penicillium nucicola TaxID=1850975 RepID=UPI00254585BC|nr:uncharacterized protein N7511_007639 [Penicillium nucicola]KAJ5753486.1 hypothetical protein N7511_007639 [Penicillium nucicola]
MAISMADCLEEKGKQSMWQKLGLRKWLGREDRESGEEPRASDTAKDSHPKDSHPKDPNPKDKEKQDNITRRISRKVGVGLPRTTTFKRQSSEQRDRLAPLEPEPQRRALSADRDPLTARSRSPPVDPRLSAPEVQWIGPPATTVESPSEPEPNVPDWVPYPDMDTESESEPEKLPEETLELELEQRWILNLSMHFRDRSEREKFFVTYAEAPNRWRRVTISCDYRDAPPDSLERDLKELRYQRDKCARIYESIRESLLEIQFYDTVTNLKLETLDGRLHVHVTEDVNETIPYPPISSIGHLGGARCVPEHFLHFESHLSGFVYKVQLGGRAYIKKEIPGPDTVDEFLYEINALHALNGAPSVIQVEGIVVDEQRDVVKGLLISYAEQGALVDILYEQRGRTSFARRERWARQIVQGLCEIHESGYVQGDFTLANIVVDAYDNAKIIDINRRGCPVGWEPPEIAAKIESNQRISMYIGVKTDLYQLGMTLWALAMEEDEPERQPRPLFIGEDPMIPDYYRRVVDICLSPTPRHRLSAKELLFMFPSDLPTARASPAAQPMEIATNDPRHVPIKHNWAHPPASGIGLSLPRGFMRQVDQYSSQKEFADNTYRDLQHPIFADNNDPGNRSTITLAECTEDTSYPSKPSSSSTLNHHESHDAHGYLDDRPSRDFVPDLSRGNTEPEIVPVSQTTITPTSNGFYDYTMEEPELSDEVVYLDDALLHDQQTFGNQPLTALTPDQPQPDEHTTHITSSTTPPPTGPPHKETASQSHAKSTDIVPTSPAPPSALQPSSLILSALPINPAFGPPETPGSRQTSLVDNSPPSTPRSSGVDRPFAGMVGIKPTFTTPPPPTSSLFLSALPMNPSLRYPSNYFRELTTPNSVYPTIPEVPRQDGEEPYLKKAADIQSSVTQLPSLFSSILPLNPALQQPKASSADIVTSSVTNVNRDSSTKHVGQLLANTATASETLREPYSPTSLSLSVLPINPAIGPLSASIDSLVTVANQHLANLAKQDVESTSEKVADLNDVPATSETPSLSLSSLPINPAMPHLETPRSFSTTPLTHSHSIETPESEYPPQPTHMANIKPTLRRVPGHESSLFVSALPINPALADLNTNTTSASAEMTPPAQVSRQNQSKFGQQSQPSSCFSEPQPRNFNLHQTR